MVTFAPTLVRQTITELQEGKKVSSCIIWQEGAVPAGETGILSRRTITIKGGRCLEEKCPHPESLGTGDSCQRLISSSQPNRKER